jgi:hypothetical protein
MSKIPKLLIIAIVVCAIAPEDVRGDTCFYMPGDNEISGDATLSPLVCDNEEFRDYFWDAYDFDEEDWDNGFGFGQACDIEKPLNRTYNGIAVLHYSAPDPPTEADDFSGNFLRWGGNYAMSRIDELDCRCGSGQILGEQARTRDPFIGDAWTRLFWPFFYSPFGGVVFRAGTLVHEARHMDGFEHEGVCSRAGSCDEFFNLPISQGPNTFEVIWLWWFYVDAVQWTPFMREQAKDMANLVLAQGFVNPPLNDAGTGVFQIE